MYNVAVEELFEVQIKEFSVFSLLNTKGSSLT